MSDGLDVANELAELRLAFVALRDELVPKLARLEEIVPRITRLEEINRATAQAAQSTARVVMALKDETFGLAVIAGRDNGGRD